MELGRQVAGRSEFYSASHPTWPRERPFPIIATRCWHFSFCGPGCKSSPPCGTGGAYVRVLAIAGVGFAVILAPIYVSRADHKVWDPQFTDALASDLHHLGGAPALWSCAVHLYAGGLRRYSLPHAVGAVNRPLLRLPDLWIGPGESDPRFPGTILAAVPKQPSARWLSWAVDYFPTPAAIAWLLPGRSSSKNSPPSTSCTPTAVSRPPNRGTEPIEFIFRSTSTPACSHTARIVGQWSIRSPPSF